MPAPDGVLVPDLSLTPLTNSFPVWRLQLRKGEHAEIRAAYIDGGRSTFLQMASAIAVWKRADFIAANHGRATSDLRSPSIRMVLCATIPACSDDCCEAGRK